MEDNSIDLIVSDVPYKITPRGCTGNTGGMLTGKQSMKGNLFDNANINPQQYMKEFYRVLKEYTHCYVMCNHKELYNMLNAAKEAGLQFIKSLIWNKQNKIMGRFYMSQFEYILFFRKGKAKKINHCGTSDILEIPNKKHKDSNGRNYHNAEKPIELMKILIDNSSQPGEIVLDPFCGIGSTCIASKELNRQYIGIEIDPKYYEICNKRLNNESLE